MVALVGLLDATEAPVWGSSPRPRLRSACSTQLAREAIETLVARGCASNYFHFSGRAPPSDLVRESRRGLGAMFLGIEHVGLSSRG